LQKAGLTRASGHPGAVTLIQRFGSALNLNIHFHMIFVDGVYLPAEGDSPAFRHVPAPTGAELQDLVQQIAARIGQVLEQRGLIERDMQNAWLAMQAEGGPMDDLIGHSITYRIAVGPCADQKLFTLQTVPARAEDAEQGDHRSAANAGGFSLPADLDIQPHQRAKLERLCRYVSRPPIAVERLSLTSSGQVRYQLKTPYRDGTTHIVLEPLDLMARLAALVPPPRMHLTRFHGVFAPHSKLRAAVTPAHRGMGSPGQSADQADSDQPATARHVAMIWARRLKRVFGIEIEHCTRCGGKIAIIASIEDPQVIAKILAHLELTSPDQNQIELPLGARCQWQSNNPHLW
jgi:Putative transposase